MLAVRNKEITSYSPRSLPTCVVNILADTLYILYLLTERDDNVTLRNEKSGQRNGFSPGGWCLLTSKTWPAFLHSHLRGFSEVLVPRCT